MRQETNWKSSGGFLLCVVAAWVAISAGDRIVWAKTNGGLKGYMGPGARGIVLKGCEGRGVEYKASDEAGALQYRCNTIGEGPAMLWPFRRGGQSASLANAVAQPVLNVR